MTVLAFDTSTPSTVVGLRLPDGSSAELVDRRAVGQRPGHQEQLLLLAQRLLADHGLSLGEVSRLAVGVGPGTYTGLRVGVATARALAQALDLELVPVPSLAAVAYACRSAAGLQDVLVLNDARRGELFAALYRLEGAGPPTELIAPRPLRPAAIGDLLARVLERCPKPPVVAGDGLEVVAQELAQAGLAAAGVTGSSGRAFAELGWLGRPAELAAVVPDYRREPDAVPTKLRAEAAGRR